MASLSSRVWRSPDSGWFASRASGMIPGVAKPSEVPKSSSVGWLARSELPSMSGRRASQNSQPGSGTRPHHREQRRSNPGSMITGRMGGTAARSNYNDNVFSESSARLAHSCLARSDKLPRKFPQFQFFRLYQLESNERTIRSELLTWRLLREAEVYRTPISANARCKRGVEASKV